MDKRLYFIVNDNGIIAIEEDLDKAIAFCKNAWAALSLEDEE